MVVGHEQVVSRIEAERPAVSLLLGPSSVGKRTVAEYLRMVWRIDDGDTLRIEQLTVPAARALVFFASTAATHDRKLAIVEIDGAEHSALHILLKTLEEGHDSTDFILISEHPPLVTILARSVVYRFGFLSEAQVATVLVERRFQPDKAARMAEMSGGQVSRALDVVSSREIRHDVMMVVKAFRETEPDTLELAAKTWTDAHTRLLAQWCRESLTGRYLMFSEAETIQPRQVPFRILQALTTDVRPKLLVRANLMSALRHA